MARGSRGKSETPRTETQSAPSRPLQPTLPSPALPSDITMPIPFTDSQDAQGLVNPSYSGGEKFSTQVTADQVISAKNKKRSRRKTKKDKAQEQGSPIPAISPDIRLDYREPMPTPSTSPRGLSITLPKPNVGSPPISPCSAFAEPIKSEETLRQENEKLKRELEAANNLARGLEEIQLQLEEEVKAWKQRCEGFSEVVKELRTEMEEMINSRISKFFDKMEGEKKEDGKEEEGKKQEGKKKREDKVKEKKKREGKGKKEEEIGEEKRGNTKKGKWKEGKEMKEGKKGGDGKDGEEVEAKARKAREKTRQSSIEQIQAYRQRKKQEERRRNKWWVRFHIKLSRTFWRRVVMTLFLLGLITLLLAPFALIAIDEILAYNRAHAQRIARLKLKESRSVQLAKAVAQFAADLSPEPIRGILYHSFLNDGWNLDEPYY